MPYVFLNFIVSDWWVGGLARRLIVARVLTVCLDKSHWDLIAKSSTYIDSLLAVLEVGLSYTVELVHAHGINTL